jgi:hypothetical protein
VRYCKATEERKDDTVKGELNVISVVEASGMPRVLTPLERDGCWAEARMQFALAGWGKVDSVTSN